MTLADDVLRALRRAEQPLDDDVIAAQLRVVRQHVNQTCRRLEAGGVLRRVPGPDGKIVNLLRESGSADSASPPSVRDSPRTTVPADAARVAEDEVKTAVKRHLEADGFTVTVAWGRERGIDIDARSGVDRWIIEAKGGAPRGPQQVNYFLGALGELVQRMDDDTARYGLALPDDPQYRGLVNRLPAAARRKLDLTVFFVTRTGGELTVVVDEPRLPL